jgi:hypothetical protein
MSPSGLFLHREYANDYVMAFLATPLKAARSTAQSHSLTSHLASTIISLLSPVNIPTTPQPAQVVFGACQCSFEIVYYFMATSSSIACAHLA